MKRTNYHIHTLWCDGSASCAEMAKAAYDAGMDSIGFSSHFTMTYPDDCGIEAELIPDYLRETARIRSVYEPLGMEVLTSFEADYYMDTEAFSPEFAAVRPKLDYTIGSIHTMGFRDDGEMGIIDAFPEKFVESIRQIYGTEQAFAEAYYGAVGDMAEREKPDIVGHLDLLKKNNFILGRSAVDTGTKAYRDAAFEALRRIRDAGCILEINTGGIARYTNPGLLYPDPELTAEAVRLGIPLMINGDSHSTEGIDTYYTQAEELLRSLGVRTLMRRGQNGWEEAPL